MGGESLIIFLIVGVIAGWLAGLIVSGGGFGLIGDLVVGIVGAFIASALFPRLGVHIGSGIGEQIVYAMLGAIILLLVVRLIRRV